jgi:7-alpha-hydroxysteroid dehydrogenase
MSFDALADFRIDGHQVSITGGAQNIGAGIATMITLLAARGCKTS